MSGMITKLEFAYKYALPIYEISCLRYRLQFDPRRRRRLPSNYLFHKRTLATPDDRLVTAPNADTLYSLAIIDLRGGPVRLDVPPSDGRYYSIALIDAYTNNFSYISRRTTGNRAGRYLLVGPEYADVDRDNLPIILAPTPIVVLILRVLLHGDEDMSAAHFFQDGFELRTFGTLPHSLAPIAPVAGCGENFVAVVNRAIAENPPPPADAPVLDRIGEVGIGPHAAPFVPELRQAWNTLFGVVQRSLVEITENWQHSTKTGGDVVNGWLYPPVDKGNFGTDYQTRAEIALTGLFAHRREENMVVIAVSDDKGASFDTHHRYRLRLPSRMPVQAFWSLSIYEVQSDGRSYFGDNPLRRYAIGDRTPGLRRNADGTLDILIQRSPPERNRQANWLSMPNGTCRLALRNYEPRPELLDGRFRYPAIERLG